MKQKYEEQVKLLVRVLPYVAKEECFALKGGTAINLFVRDLPRLSVDIDLTYLGFENRDVATKNINDALLRITEALNKVGIKSNVLNNNKIICSTQSATIKIEPNYTIRGYAFEPQKMRTNPKVEERFGFANINVISRAELYGGKICAALDRQHPRDLFDVRYLLDSEGISEEIKDGFTVALLSHNRPPHELLQPNIQNQEDTFAKEFIGMSNEPFTYQNHLETLNELVIGINKSLAKTDKEFLISFFNVNPNWELLSLPNLSKLPAVQWKLLNLEKLKSSDEKKLSEQLQNLQDIFK